MMRWSWLTPSVPNCPLGLVFHSAGGERSMSGHSGPGHMMNRGGMSG